MNICTSYANCTPYIHTCVLLKALPPVCMKYTAQGESRVANRAWGKPKCYIYLSWGSPRTYLSYKWSISVLSVLVYYTHSSIATYMVVIEPFDPPTQNTINTHRVIYVYTIYLVTMVVTGIYLNISHCHGYHRDISWYGMAVWLQIFVV